MALRPSSAVKTPRLRFAPSPTGSLHIGGLRTALYNHLLARKWGGKWILRIEDTDQLRKVDGAVDSLRRSLEWAGLEYDEGPGAGSRGPWSYVQSERLDLYRQHAQMLLDSGKAYRCFCTPDELDQIRTDLRASGSNDVYDRRGLHLSEEDVARRLKGGEKHVVRFKSSPHPVPHTDLVYGGKEAFPSMALDDMVLIKSDGYPTYHLASVVDDHEMGITHVFRGEEWLASVNKHLQLYHAFGWEKPEFAHLPLLVNPDGTKLSKRHGATSVEDFIRRGYEPAALNNFVALMGWSGRTNPGEAGTEHTDCLTMSEMIEKFDLSRVAVHHSQILVEKLDHLQKLHVSRQWEADGESRRNMIARVKSLLVERYPNSPRAVDEKLITQMIDSERIRLTFIHEIATTNNFIFELPNLESDEARAMKKKGPKAFYQTSLEHALEAYGALPASSFESIEILSRTLDTLGSPRGDDIKKRSRVIMPVRHALTGVRAGPSVGHIIQFLGKDETLRRLKQALEQHLRDLGEEKIP